MKKSILITIIILISLSCIFVTSCSKQEDQGEVKNSADYKLTSESVSALDFDVVYGLCKDFLGEYYKDINSKKDIIDFNQYISNEKFADYTKTKTQNAKYSIENYSVKYGVINIEWHDDYVYIEIQSVLSDNDSDMESSVSEINQLILYPKDGRYYIADWYCPSTISFDKNVRDVKNKISDPYIWDDENFTNSVNTRISQTNTN